MRYITLLLIAVALAACGNVKKTSYSKTETTEQQVETSSAELITRTTIIDTTVTLPADTLEVARPMADLEDNGVLFFEDNNQSIELRYDKPTKTVKAKSIVKPQTVTVYKTETTVENRVETVKADTHTHIDTAEKQVNRWQPPWWLWLIPVAGLLYLAWRVKSHVL